MYFFFKCTFLGDFCHHEVQVQKHWQEKKIQLWRNWLWRSFFPPFKTDELQPTLIVTWFFFHARNTNEPHQIFTRQRKQEMKTHFLTDDPGVLLLQQLHAQLLLLILEHLLDLLLQKHKRHVSREAKLGATHLHPPPPPPSSCLGGRKKRKNKAPDWAGGTLPGVTWAPSVAAAALGAAEGWGSAAAAGASAAAAGGPRPVGSSRTTTTTLEPATEINSGRCYSRTSEEEGTSSQLGNTFFWTRQTQQPRRDAKLVQMLKLSIPLTFPEHR